MRTKQFVVTLFVYNSFAQFEITPAAFILSMGKAQLIVVGQDRRLVVSIEGIHVQPDRALSEMNSFEADALIIPGGTITKIGNMGELSSYVRDFHSTGRVVAAICAGPAVLAKAGVLDNHKFTTSLDPSGHSYLPSHNLVEDSLVIDGNVITAKPYANVEFGLAIARSLRLFDTDMGYESIMRELYRPGTNGAGANLTNR